MECLFYVKLNKISSWASLLPFPLSVLCSFPSPNKAVSPRCINAHQRPQSSRFARGKNKLLRLKFNVVRAVRMWARVASVSSCFLSTPKFTNISRTHQRHKTSVNCSHWRATLRSLTLTTVLPIVPIEQCVCVFPCRGNFRK